jgi:hypothetical protein
MDANRFKKTVTALRAALRHIEELRKHHPGAIGILVGRFSR